MSKKNLNDFVDIEDGIEQDYEWDGMPEFVMEDQSSKRKVVVHFRNEEDVQKFAKLMDQTITPKQKSLWHLNE